jgi:isoquinoline 1-oxidoreductase subunit beta
MDIAAFAHIGDHPLIEPSPIDVSRRAFLKVGAATGGGLLLGFALPFETVMATPGIFAPNAFVRIDSNGAVTLIMPQVEMGQGSYTAMPMLIAEELEIELSTIRLEHAPADDKLYGNPIIKFQITGGSTSVRAFWDPLRRAGATARTLLVSAAAQKWSVGVESCRAENGEVIHVPTGRRVNYGALVDTAATLPVPENVALKEPKAFKVIGTAVKRLDAKDKVTGRAQYGIDVRLPGMKVATVAACPVFGGKLASVDDSKAKAVKGVVQIIRLDDAVAVVADHMAAAKKGLAALDIKWDEGSNAGVGTADIIGQLDAASKNPGVVARKEGDVDKAMAGASKKLDAIYQVPFLAHATMEPTNCTVHVSNDGCDIWVGTQVVTRAQRAAVQITGLPSEKVRVHNLLLGGGFGRRIDIDGIVQAVQIAKQVNGPLKVIWSREEDIQHDLYRPYYYDRIAAGLDEKGMPVAWTHRVVGSSVIARLLPGLFKDGLDPDAVAGAAKPPYTLPNIQVEYVRQEPQAIPTAFWRGVGPTHNVFVVESFIDELAAAASKDPVEYRRTMLDKSPRAKAVLELAAEKSGWAQKLPPGVGHGISVQFAFGSYVSQVAEVEVAKDGGVRIRRVVCAVDCGMVVNPDTVRAQMEGGIMFGITAALFGEITLKNGRVEQSNFDNYRMLRINEAPLVEVHIINSTEAPGGIGEPGTSAVAPAVANAIFAATGKRIRKLPVNASELRST